MNEMRKLMEAVGDINPINSVTVNIPLLIRLLEFAKEDAETDIDLHKVAENLVSLSLSGNTLSMSDYEDIVYGSELGAELGAEEEFNTENDMDHDFGDDLELDSDDILDNDISLDFDDVGAESGNSFNSNRPPEF